jgi:hypothetical protein
MSDVLDVLPSDLVDRKDNKYQIYKLCYDYDQMRNSILFAINNNRNILLYSPNKTGKTTVINEIYDKLMLNNYNIIGPEPELEIIVGFNGREYKYINVVYFEKKDNKTRLTEELINLAKNNVIIETNQIPNKTVGFFQRNFIIIHAKFDLSVNISN